MDAQKIDEFESIATVDFQRNLLFGSTLRDGKDGEGRAFRARSVKSSWND